jgi:hypothetical protein
MPKIIRDSSGKFRQRPHYEQSELDMECEKIVCNFLRSIYGKIEFPVTTDDLTKLLELYTSDFDQFADLSHYGEKIEGLTEFFPVGKPKVSVTAWLSEASNYENRFRTTMTHELGHVIFHDYLYKTELIESGAAAIQICRRDDIISKTKLSSNGAVDWMEWQAGYACGAFLMPGSYLTKAIGEYRVAHGTNVEGLIEDVMVKFRVSRDAARIRLIVTNNMP